MREPEVRADTERQEIVIQQPWVMNEPVREMGVVKISAAMVPRLVAQLMSAAVALGCDLEYPPKKIEMQ